MEKAIDVLGHDIIERMKKFCRTAAERLKPKVNIPTKETSALIVLTTPAMLIPDVRLADCDPYPEMARESILAHRAVKTYFEKMAQRWNPPEHFLLGNSDKDYVISELPCEKGKRRHRLDRIPRTGKLRVDPLNHEAMYEQAAIAYLASPARKAMPFFMYLWSRGIGSFEGRICTATQSVQSEEING